MRPLIGTVTKVFYSQEKTTLVKLRVQQEGKTVEIIFSFFCSLRVNDFIHVFVEEEKGILNAISPPLVKFPYGRNETITCLIGGLKKNFKTVSSIYDDLLEKAEGKSVVEYLNSISETFVNTNDTDLLLMFSNFDPEMIKRLFSWWHKERNLRSLWLLGLTDTEIKACHRSCGEIYEICLRNPYLLYPVPIEKADSILSRYQQKLPEEQRVMGELVRLLWNNYNHRSYMATPIHHVEAAFPNWKELMEKYAEIYGVISDKNSLYLKIFWQVEETVSQKVKNLLASSPTTEVKEPLFTENLSSDQIVTLKAVLNSNVNIINSPPGTGKSTLINVIMKNFLSLGIVCVAASFTGRAVSRLRSLTKRSDCSTMHRLIYRAKSASFKEDPLFGFTHLILDECSMIDLDLLYQFITTFPQIEYILAVGDIHQLPCMKAGSFFSQLIISEKVPVYQLTTFHRFITRKTQDGITLNSQALVNNTEANFQLKSYENFILIEGSIESTVKEILEALQRGKVNARDIVVITPYNRNIDYINSLAQEVFNKNSPAIIDSRGNKWKTGDIIQCKDNLYDIMVFNGDNGVIISTNGKEVEVDFGDSGIHVFALEPKYKYTKKYQAEEEEMDSKEHTVERLALAYCISVDRSQGGEWRFALFYLPDDANLSSGFLNYNRLNTGITRGKQVVWCLGNIDGINSMANKRLPYRCEYLSQRLKEN